MSGTIFAITALCITDLERSTRFYCDALGYRALTTTRPDGGALGVSARFLDLDGRMLELVEFRDSPPPEKADFPVSRTGLISHLAYNVANLAETEAAVVAAGGTIAELTRSQMQLEGLGSCTIIYVRDPDGIWIELISVDEAARRRYVGLDQ
ncbi:VOC family protein [Sphingosinicella soli]|uniref:Catechol 2,3-dioxygenase-like lactoylglutathione lyase family enzyme n=1 Tax=Sphingosinicella soli TaxID=333708 RepID=A0A7W7B2B4_9SPHN|nr:VOC family protein [Sphingosinicella soli]MBB4632681.1 catechol 2,3-dioxygenase-like lactoylglutathione lyase family enzyme [Sphingosinicella soli]